MCTPPCTALFMISKSRIPSDISDAAASVASTAFLQGTLSPAELQWGAKWLGLNFPAAEMAELIALFDENGDGTITLQVLTAFIFRIAMQT